MKINKKFCKSHSSRGGSKVEYIVIHWVGAVSTAKNNADYFARANPLASAHFFVDKKSIWQSVPTSRAAWAVGGGRQSSRGGKYFGRCKNVNSISIELCCTRQSGKLIVDPRAVKKAAPLVQDLMKDYKIPASRVIRHFDVTGKDCPRGFTDEKNWAKLHKTLTGAK